MSLDLARRILAIDVANVGFGRSTSASGVTASNTTGLEGDAERTITATVDGATWNLSFTTALNGLAAGMYTFSVGMSIEGGSVSPQFYASERAVPMALAPGRHVVNVPFYFDPANSGNERVGVLVPTMFNGTTIRTGTFRIAAGIDAQRLGRTELYVADIPASGTHRKGDIAWHSDPASGEALGWVCTVAGTPGTWLPFGTLNLLGIANTWTAGQTYSATPAFTATRAGVMEMRAGNSSASITGGTDLFRLLGYSGDSTAPGAGDVASIRAVQGTTAPNSGEWDFYVGRNDARALKLRSNGVVAAALTPTYADNAAAVAGGLVAGDVYKTATGELRIVV